MNAMLDAAIVATSTQKPVPRPVPRSRLLYASSLAVLSVIAVPSHVVSPYMRCDQNRRSFCSLPSPNGRDIAEGYFSSKRSGDEGVSAVLPVLSLAASASNSHKHQKHGRNAKENHFIPGAERAMRHHDKGQIEHQRFHLHLQQVEPILLPFHRILDPKRRPVMVKHRQTPLYVFHNHFCGYIPS
jgi:hypothetical protein